MKIFYLIISILILSSCNIQKKSKIVEKNLTINNIASSQIYILNKYKNTDIDKRNKILLDSIYTPNIDLWSNYLGNEKDFLEWINNNGFKSIDNWNNKSKILNLNLLSTKLKDLAIEMYQFTGFSPKGKWNILYGPSWTDLGGFNDGTMLIDWLILKIQEMTILYNTFPTS